MASRFSPWAQTTAGTLWCAFCGESIPQTVLNAPGAVLEALRWHWGAMRVRYEGSGHCTFALQTGG